MAFKVKMKNLGQVSIKNVVRNLVATVLMLWIGGTIIQEVGTTMNGTCSPFFRGLTLIGWTIASPAAAPLNDATCLGNANTITDTSGAGILTVVGLIGIASVVLQFVDFRF